MQGRRVLSKSTYDLARTMFMVPGTTITQVSLTLGIAWQTAKKIATKLDTPQCGCGQDSNHRGICSSRSGSISYSQENVTTSEFKSETTELPEEELTTGKCAEISCTFPSYRGGKCRQHYIDSRSSFSLLSSTIRSAYFFPERHYNRRAL